MNEREPHVDWDDDFDEPTLWAAPEIGWHGTYGFVLGLGATKAEAIADARDSLVRMAQQLDQLEREA